MNRILKISLISVGSVAATALVSSLSYVKGKRDGIALTMKKYSEGQLNTGTDRRPQPQPKA